MSSCLAKNRVIGSTPSLMYWMMPVSTQDWWLQISRYLPLGSSDSWQGDAPIFGGQHFIDQQIVGMDPAVGDTDDSFIGSGRSCKHFGDAGANHRRAH